MRGSTPVMSGFSYFQNSPCLPLIRRGISRIGGQRYIGMDWSDIGTLVLNAATIAAPLWVSAAVSGAWSAIGIGNTLRNQSVQINDGIWNQFNRDIWISGSRDQVDRRFRYAVEQIGIGLTLGIIELRTGGNEFSIRDTSFVRVHDPLTGRYQWFRGDRHYFFATSEAGHGFISDLEERIRNIR